MKLFVNIYLNTGLLIPLWSNIKYNCINIMLFLIKVKNKNSNISML